MPDAFPDSKRTERGVHAASGLGRPQIDRFVDAARVTEAA
jgi:hypothetical protein